MIHTARLLAPRMLWLPALTLTACAWMEPAEEPLSDDAVRQYVAEWRDAKPSIERLTELEGDLTFLLAEVSRMTDLNPLPEQLMPEQASLKPASAESVSTLMAPAPARVAASASESVPILTAPIFTSVPTGPAGQGESWAAGAVAECPAEYHNNYRKSLALTYFPRAQAATSNAGGLHQVDQHLPLLLGANLQNRHAAFNSVAVPSILHGAEHQGEFRAAAQAKHFANQHRAQFVVSGNIRDMSLVNPELAYAQGGYNRLVKGVHNLRNRDELNSQSRRFSFDLQVRDGLTGQVVFNQGYETLGHWDALDSRDIGFGTARFWQTDYGQQIQTLVARASDDLAVQLRCQAFTARVEFRPGERQVVIHSGANNGLNAGDVLELYQLVLHPIAGQYGLYHARMVSSHALVSVLEVYPSHSIALLDQDLSPAGQYLVMAP